MVGLTVPMQVSCSKSSIGLKMSADGKSVPMMQLGFDINVSLQDLLEAVAAFQAQSIRPDGVVKSVSLKVTAPLQGLADSADDSGSQQEPECKKSVNSTPMATQLSSFAYTLDPRTVNESDESDSPRREPDFLSGNSRPIDAQRSPDVPEVRPALGSGSLAPPGLSATKGRIPPGLFRWAAEPASQLPSMSNMMTGSSHCSRVRVDNITRGARARNIKNLFEEAGPIASCELNEGVAIVNFHRAEDAQTAVQLFDGAIIEVLKKSGLIDRMEADGMRKGSSSVEAKLIKVPWMDGLALRSKLEAEMGPLTGCQFRRGEGWLTIARNSYLKRADQGLELAQFKGSVISVTLDMRTEEEPPNNRAFQLKDSAELQSPDLQVLGNDVFLL
ncbi:unnamed protein product [Polarella glacialis]|uniref:RRM domain-containing protein n=1 Tax=Polarella glacialis TaxID=89957 RepID=A0A813L2P4_POLGL|nr:unnamed protein product [Polarella glacialis]|mmetsp:Transcript_68545/g.123514  ORF Transcript_68545/g.123514 Transcript_68545/m.123514 type:complete len:387 (+) Transcript_68545:146-1306(+)